MAELGTVLVIDDEAYVRGVTIKVLELEGYRVLSAINGREAVEKFAAEADAIGLVILDVTLPDMSGCEVLAELRRIRPDAPVIMMSGGPKPDELDERDVSIFIEKPFSLHHFIALVARFMPKPPDSHVDAP